MIEEIRLHLEMRTERNIGNGMDPATARRAAELSFGGMDQIKERCRYESRWQVAERISQDLRFACRQMRRNPVFSSVVALTFALGIAATVVIFSLAYAVLLRPLPFPKSEQLVTLGERHLLRGYARGTSYPDFLDWKARSTSYAGMDGITTVHFVLSQGSATERLTAQKVTGGYFSLIGVHPELGRWLSQPDDRVGTAPVAVISDFLWRRAFESKPDVVGSRVKLSDREYTIVGVMPATFVGITGDLYNGEDSEPEIWTPLAADAAESSRNAGPLRVVGRLKDGVSIETAAAEMKVISARLAVEYPADNENFTVRVGSMRSDLTEEIRPALYLLMTAAAFLLVISCLNIANLLLVRSTTRVAELSLRAALGADRWRIVAQLLVESGIISLPGVSSGGACMDEFVHPAGVFPGRRYSMGYGRPKSASAYSECGCYPPGGNGGRLAPAFRCSKLDLNEALKSEKTAPSATLETCCSGFWWSSRFHSRLFYCTGRLFCRRVWRIS